MKILKKSVAVIIVALMLISVMSVVNAADETSLTVTATSNLSSASSVTYDVSKDKTITVTYNLSTKLALLDSEGAITYDSSVLKVKSVTLPNVTNSIVNTEPADTIKFNHTVGVGEANFAKGAALVVVKFEVLSAGETTVDLQLAELDAEDSGEKMVELVLKGEAVSDEFNVTNELSAPKEPELDKTTKKLAAGKTYKIKVKNTNEKATFSSNKKTVATVNKNGVVTALKKGNATITVKVEGKKLKLKVTVKSNPKLKKFDAKKTYSVNKNGTLSFKIKGKASAIKNKYNTTNKSVAKVTSKAKADTVKIKGVKSGSATIKVTVNNVKTIKIKVKVK